MVQLIVLVAIVRFTRPHKIFTAVRVLERAAMLVWTIANVLPGNFVTG
jgi:hypothetical protein